MSYSLRDFVDACQAEIGQWADDTFPQSSQETIIAHLRDEVGNEITVDCDPHELADAALLLLHLAHKRGLSLASLVREKYERNKQRTWQSEKNERGFFSHTSEGASA